MKKVKNPTEPSATNFQNCFYYKNPKELSATNFKKNFYYKNP